MSTMKGTYYNPESPLNNANTTVISEAQNSAQLLVLIEISKGISERFVINKYQFIRNESLCCPECESNHCTC